MLKKAIPHLFTSMNLLCGCLATFFAFSHQFNAALMFVFLGVFFDFFDGFFARLLGVESALGVQLDSLADLITSGLAPGVLMYQLFVISGVKSVDYTFKEKIQIKNLEFSYSQNKKKIFDKLLPLHEVMFIESNPVPAKYSLSLLNLMNDEVRLPLVTGTEESKKIIKKVLAELSII